ncbi:prolyl oligopeptidase family serine peptidase [Streptomyces sp. NPDC058657]|uniref:S9 family peptidase n=1 Tax=unclassified Streptomyces TaxID=2593676 RepID=UPI003665F8B2
MSPEPLADPFLALSARTGRFSYGAPRAAAFADGGRLLCFLRSSGPADPYDALWVLDTVTGEERQLADPRALAPEGGEPPLAERQLRERIRLTAPGIGSYSLSADGRFAVFALYGRLFRTSTGPKAETEEIPSPGPVFDPRPDGEGSRIAYVCEDRLYVSGCAGSGPASAAPRSGPVAVSPDDGARWGIAEFAAAEELGRSRGHWWSPGGRMLLAARVDESALPRFDYGGEFAYPRAGGPNADVQLWVLDAGAADEGGAGGVRLDWDTTAYPYVTDAGWDTDGEILLTVQDRLQHEALLLAADPATGSTRLLSSTSHPLWVDPLPGTPARLADGRMLTSADTPQGEARGLALDGHLLTGTDLQVRSFEREFAGGLLVTAARDEPADQHVVLIDPDTGALRPLTDGSGVHSVTASTGTLLITAARPGEGVRRTVHTEDGRELMLRDLSEPLPYRVAPRLARVTGHRLPTAVVLPRGHAPGRRLPVLLDVYGGPGAQAVTNDPRAQQHRQWWADQGFAVVTVDNRGTSNVSPAFTHAMYRGFSRVTLDDQVAALHELASLNPELDLGRVAVRGWSYGGYLAALAVLRRPDVFHVGIAGAPPTDFRAYDTAYTERYLGLPDENPGVYEEDCLVKDAAALRRPLLLIHGLADDNVHPSHSLRLSEALTRAGREHELLTLPGVSHMTPGGVRERLMVRELAYLRKVWGE